MANELQISYLTGKTLYALIRSATGTIWNGSSFETYDTVNYATYVVTASEQGTASFFYVASFPSSITAGTYSIIFKEQAGASPAESDATVGMGDFNWGGSSAFNFSDLATSGQIARVTPVRISRGQMVQNFPFKMVSAADHVTPMLSGIVSGQISRDGGAFGALESGTVTEIGNGFYKVTLTSGDLNATTVALTFTGAGVSGGLADPRDFAIILQRTSGQ